MRAAGMVGILGEYLHGDGACQHLYPVTLISHSTGGTQQRQGIIRRDLMIVRIGLIELLHRVPVREFTLRCITLVEKLGLHRTQKSLFTIRGRLRQACLRRRTEPFEHLPGFLQITLVLERMVVA